MKATQAIEKLPLDMLAKEYRNLENQLLKKWDAPLINDFLCMIAFGVSRKIFENHPNPEATNFHNDIMIGQGDIISAEPAIRIRKMAEIAKKTPNTIELLMQETPKQQILSLNTSV